MSNPKMGQMASEVLKPRISRPIRSVPNPFRGKGTPGYDDALSRLLQILKGAALARKQRNDAWERATLC